jgi:UDP-glucose 4-epimerase
MSHTNDLPVAVEEDDVDREAHEERVHGRSGVDQHAGARLEAGAPEQAAHPGERATGDLAALADEPTVGGAHGCRADASHRAPYDTQPMRAIVTGGAGFIGSHLVDALVACGTEAHVVDDLTTGSRENVSPEAELHELDIREEALERLAARLGPDVVFHLAAQADVGTSVERPAFDAQVNVVGTVRVLEAARAAGARVVFASTGGAIYGECERPAREDDEPEPLSPYAASKLAAEGYLATWSRLYGDTHITCRLANVYGPRQLPKLEGGVVAIFLDRLRDGGEIEIFGDGEQTRDFVFVGDVVEALLAAASAPRGGVYNVGTGLATSVVDLYRLCTETAGVDQEPCFSPERPGDVRHSVLDASHAGRELGWRAGTTLAEGLAQTWASVRPR